MGQRRKYTRPGTRNVEATACRLRTILTTASASRPPPREPRQAVATLGSQSQTGAPAATKETRGSRAMRQLFVVFKFRISNFEFRFPADPATEARTGTVRKTERTSQNCIVRLPTIRH